MKNRHVSRILTSLATIGCCALLLADSAEPYCSASKSKFERTFDYTTTCNGDHSGRIRISTAGPISFPVSGDRTPPGEVSMTLVSGDQPNADVAIGGGCDKEDDPTLIKSVTLTFPGSSGTLNGATGSSSTGGGGTGGMGGAAATEGKISSRCTVLLGSQLGKHIDCDKADDTGRAGCTLQLTALP